MNKEGEVRKFYAAVNKMKKKEFKPRTTSGCRNETGAIILDETVTLKIWADHFQKLLNKQHPGNNVGHVENTEYPHTTTTTEEEGDEIPSIDEVRKAIQRMNNNRAPGEDGILAELLKYGGEPVITALTDIIEEVWITERMPTSWSNGIICPIHKKGDIGRCENYRGITLLDTAYKALVHHIPTQSYKGH